MHDAETSKQGFAWQWIGLLAIIAVVVFFVTFQRLRTADKQQTGLDVEAASIAAVETMRAFDTAIAGGNVDAALAMVVEPGRDKPAIILLCGTADVDAAMRSSFGQPYAGFPLPNEIVVDEPRSFPGDGLFAFVDTDVFVRVTSDGSAGQARQARVDLSNLPGLAEMEAGRAMAMRHEFRRLAGRVRDGEFDSFAAARDAVAAAVLTGALKSIDSGKEQANSPDSPNSPDSANATTAPAAGGNQADE